ncbi:CHY zinc finger protein [uncultured Microbacterium sp.]|uniref:CHY zinc finger protein n=1 Tax=uncultured Microbacterium sp. TaxID=191216 RepID=UPI0025E386B1|nr:CHY zinc finger protein [uncultured Microbacterium sp.]
MPDQTALRDAAPSDPRRTMRGRPVDAQTRCVHYRTALDIVAIRFACCGEYYPCHACHEETADHPARTWPADRRDATAILCGACGAELSIAAYLAVTACPRCGTGFNPRCALHADLYFAPQPRS